MIKILIILFSLVLWAPPATPSHSNESMVLNHLFLLYETKHGLPVGLLKAVAIQESGLREEVITCEVTGAMGELGIMQIRPEFHDVDPCDPREAINYAGKYLKSLYKRFGTWYEALVAYNWGPTNLAKRGIGEAPENTLNYSRSVLSKIGIKRL